MNTRHRAIRIVVAILLCFSFPAGSAFSAQVDAVWNAGSSNWNTAANWLPAVVPNNGTGGNTYHVKIDNGAGTNAVVALNGIFTIDLLTVSAGDTLNFNNSQDLRIEIGPIVNDGLISLNGANSNTELLLASSMSLNGTGALQIGNSGINRLVGVTGGTPQHLTHAATHTIRGGGTFGADSLTLTNNGLIEASTANTMTFDLAIGANVNAGTIQAVGTGVLNFNNTEIDNTSGFIKALGTSTVNLNTALINGGQLQTDAGAAISGHLSTLRNITLTGLLRQDNIEDLIYEGTITNNGTIQVNSVNSATEVQIHANGATFTGTGVLLGNNDTVNYINDTAVLTPPLLVNSATHTIRGSINLGNNRVNLTNQGMIDANQTVPINMDLAAGVNINTGTIQGSAAGTLNINDSIIDNTAGTLKALDTSHVRITNSTIDGGPLQAATGATFSANGATFRNISLTGLLQQFNVDDALYEGTITNNGTIQLNALNSMTEFRVHDNGVTLAGTGVLEGNNDPDVVNYINDNAAVNPPLLINTASHTIRGGIRVGNNRVRMTNQGLIHANIPTAPMTIDFAAGTNINTGTIQASTTSTLSINDTVLDNTAGSIKALDTSAININSSTIDGGSLQADPGASFSGNASTLKNIALTGLLRHDNTEDFIYEGTITNNGTIQLIAVNSATDIIVPSGGTTFTGVGLISMSSNASNRFVNNGAVAPLVNALTHTIRGAGSLGVNGLTLTNNGLIDANQAVALTIDLADGSNTNSGTIQASATGTLNINDTVLGNSAGVIKALDTSAINITNSIIDGGLLQADPGASFSGDASTLKNITLSGLLRHDNTEDLTYEGTISNNGTIQLNAVNSATDILIPTGGTIFAGTGQISMGANNNNRIIAAGAPAPAVTNGPAHTVRGGGQFGVNSLSIINQGSIVADQAVALTIDPEDTLGLQNAGAISVTGVGAMTISTGAFTTSGSVSVDATRTLTRTGPFPQTAGTTKVNGTLSASGGIQLTGGTLSGNGTVSGAGSLVTNGATVAPGDAIGRLSLNSGLSQSAGGTLSFEIGGLTPITEHDVLAVLGTIQLNGVFKARFVNGFDPVIGNTFTVMTYPNTPLGTLGVFTSVDVPCNLPGRSVQVTVTTTAVIVSIVAATTIVDINCDCAFTPQIDIPAFITAAFNPALFASTYPGCPITNADFNADTVVNGLDVNGFVHAIIGP